ncbi:transposase [Pengzhenrongella phosphoraccumulans]|uniref:transposase n=1 Tax=Pengzhenrongella phosphoraccumulans TaxID=3114394 RepID=UPI00388D1F8B
MVCDGLKGLPDATSTAWELALVQICVIHYADVGVMPMLPPDPLRSRGFVLARSA